MMHIFIFQAMIFNSHGDPVQIDVPVYAEDVVVKPAEIAKHGLEEGQEEVN